MDSLIKELEAIDAEAERKREAYIGKIRAMIQEENARKVMPGLWSGVPGGTTPYDNPRRKHDDEVIIMWCQPSNTVHHISNYLNIYTYNDTHGGWDRRLPNDYAELCAAAVAESRGGNGEIVKVLDKYQSKGCLFEQLQRAEERVKEMHLKLRIKNEELRELRSQHTATKQELKEANETISALKQMIEESQESQ